MNCSKCGFILKEDDVFCPNCGTPVPKVAENNFNNNMAANNFGNNTVGNNFNNNTVVNNANINNGGMNYSYERPINQQPNVPNNAQPNMNVAQNGNNKSSGNTVKICVIIVIAIAIMIAVGFTVYAIISALNKNNSTTNLDGQTTQSATSGNSNPVTQVANTQNTSTYKVNFAGFKLYIPDDYIYQLAAEDKALNIGDANSSWVAQLTILQLPFQQLKQNRSVFAANLVQNLAEYNPKASEATVETIDGVEFVLIELELAGNHEIVGLAQLNSMYTAILELANEDNEYNKELLKNITPIIKTAEMDEETKNLENDVTLKMSDIVKALEDANNEQTDG